MQEKDVWIERYLHLDSAHGNISYLDSPPAKTHICIASTTPCTGECPGEENSVSYMHRQTDQWHSCVLIQKMYFTLFHTLIHVVSSGRADSYPQTHSMADSLVHLQKDYSSALNYHFCPATSASKFQNQKLANPYIKHLNLRESLTLSFSRVHLKEKTVTLTVLLDLN